MQLLAAIDWRTVLLAALTVLNTAVTGVLVVWMRHMNRRGPRAG